MLGTIINAAAIVLGGLLGSLFGSKIRDEYVKGIMAVMGFTVAAIGIQSAVGIRSFLVVVLSMAFGTLIGMLLKTGSMRSATGPGTGSRIPPSARAPSPRDS